MSRLIVFLMLCFSIAFSPTALSQEFASDQLLKDCAEGDASACLKLGIHLSEGPLKTRDFELSAKLFEKACFENLGKGCAGRIVLHQNGKVPFKNPTTASVILSAACENGLPQVCLVASSLFKRSRDKEAPNNGHIVSLLKIGCAGDDQPSCEELSSIVVAGYAGEVDEYVEILRRSCDDGSFITCQNLGFELIFGDSTTKDSGAGASLLKRACDHEKWTACNFLGLLYESGNGVEQNYLQAARLFSAACQNNVGAGCAGLSDMYRQGTGVPKDLDLSVEYSVQACRKGFKSYCQ